MHSLLTKRVWIELWSVRGPISNLNLTQPNLRQTIRSLSLSHKCSSKATASKVELQSGVFPCLAGRDQPRRNQRLVTVSTASTNAAGPGKTICRLQTAQLEQFTRSVFFFFCCLFCVLFPLCQRCRQHFLLSCCCCCQLARSLD